MSSSLAFSRLAFSRLAFSRPLLIAGIVVLGLSACGRRGALEAPPDPNAAPVSQGADGTSAGQGTVVSPIGTPKRTPDRGYTIPKKSFILDPLL